MTAAILLSQAAMPASVGQSAWRMPLGSDQGEDLYALWKSVFETAHAVAALREGEPQSGAGERAPLSDTQASSDTGDEHRAPLTGVVEGGANVYEPSTPAVVDTQIHQSLLPSGVEGDTRAEVATDVQSSEESSGGPPLTMARVPNAGTAAAAAATAAMATDQPEQTFQVEQGAQATLDAAAQQPGVTDSVSVFVHGAAVAIVVRDAALSDRDAVSSAFETARQLTGHSTALQRLTLNGRTLYQQQIEPDPQLAPPVPTLVFAC